MSIDDTFFCPDVLILFLSNVSFIHKRFVTFSYHFVIILFVNFVSIRTVNGKSTQPRVIEGTLVEGQAAAGAGAGGGGAGGPQPIVVQVPPAGGGGSGQQFSSAGASAGASSGGAHVTGGQNGEPLTIHLPAGLGQGGAGGAPGQPIVIPLPGPGGAGGNDFGVFFINNYRKQLCFKNVLLKDLKLSDLYRCGIQISQIDGKNAKK